MPFIATVSALLRVNGFEKMLASKYCERRCMPILIELSEESVNLGRLEQTEALTNISVGDVL